MTRGPDLLDGLSFELGCFDKGYDSDQFVAWIESQGAVAVIPPRSNRKNPRDYDRHVYKDRQLVERFFAWIKQFRRIATRYDKTDTSYLSFVAFSCALMVLR